MGGYMSTKIYDWQYKVEWRYKGGDDPTSDPQYIKDRDAFFAENGNGWWWSVQRFPNATNRRSYAR